MGRRGRIHGCKVANTAPQISHMFFADDSLLFSRATTLEGNRVKECLQRYELCSGQQVNFNKSSISFSPNTSEETKGMLRTIFQVNSVANHGKYLGAPSLIGRKKVSVFYYVKERAWKKFCSWRNKFLSKAGKEILLKSVIQAIPSYIMGVFLLPYSLCDDLEKMMNSFWWGSGGTSNSGIKWKNWERLCARKDNGGVGFRRIHLFNVAMLAKQGWRLLSRPNSLVALIFKARYYCNGSFQSAQLGHNPSFVWRGLVATQKLFASGVRRRVGSGSTINIYSDPWLGDTTNPFIESASHPGLELSTVNSLMRTEVKEWDLNILQDLFSSRDIEEIIYVPLAYSRVQDSWFWAWTNNGHYSVKSGYRQLLEASRSDHSPSVTDWRCIWKLSVPPKMKNFVWRAMSRCLPTRATLQLRGSGFFPECPFCKNCNEDDVHVLINCSHARAVWSISAVGSLQEDSLSMADWWNRLKRRCTLAQLEYAAMIMWALWQRRNDLIWHNKTKPHMEVVNQATQFLEDWKLAKSQVTTNISKEINHLGKWSTPAAGTLKCNSDASLFTNPQRSGYGCVVRDHNGSFVAGMHGSFSGKFTPLMAEAISIREALSWLKGVQLQQLIIESDCLNIIQRLKSEEDDVSSVGLIINDCKSLAKGFNQCVFSFVRRSANGVAHSLARAASSVSGRVCWMVHPPTFISDVLNSDLS